MSDNWQSIAGMGMVEMPGRVLNLSAGNGGVWALVEVERKWWQFWRPRLRAEWIFVKTPA